MNNVKDLLPIGSVVLLKNGTKKLMVFGVKQKDMESGREYDYIGVIWPEGNIGVGGQFFFNHKDISQVFFVGHSDEERESFIQHLHDFYVKSEEK